MTRGEAVPRLVVAGLGCRLRGDDAVGLALVAGFAPPPGVERCLWEDADALTLAHDLLELQAPVLLVDCARMGLKAGAWRCFRADEARLAMMAGVVSSHGPGLSEALALAKALGFDGAAHIFGVEPASLEYGAGLSPMMTARLPALRRALVETVDGMLQRGEGDHGRDP